MKHAATLVSGTVVAQLILIAVQLVIRRMYSADDFGAFSLYMSIVSILVVIVTMRYELAVVLPKEEETSVSILLGGSGISLIINVLIFIFIYIVLTHSKYQVIKTCRMVRFVNHIITTIFV